MKLTIELTDAQYAGLTGVTEHNNASLPKDVAAETPEQYAQRIFSGVCDSYAQQTTDRAKADILYKYARASDSEKQAVDAALANVVLAADAQVVK